MNELTTQTMQLPEEIGEVVDFVVLNEEKLNAVKAAIRAAKKAGSINLGELERQQRELEITTVLAQCKLGELTKGMEKSESAKSKIYESEARTYKKEQLGSIGLTKQRASEYERMSAHPEVVERVIDSGEHVTKAAILRGIKEAEEETKRQEQLARKQEEHVYSEPEIEEPEWVGVESKTNTDFSHGSQIPNLGNDEPEWLEKAENDVTKAKPELTKKPHVVNNSTDNEWYTPSQYIEAAREVMGSIDLDPASNDFANETVKATKYYTEETDGLKQEWFGNVWLNPPYQTALIQAFADKLNASNFNQAIVLVNNATETQWFRNLVKKASAIMFPSGRIRYVKRDGEHGTPLQGQAFIYYGDGAERFAEVFGRYGWVVMPYHKV